MQFTDFRTLQCLGLNYSYCINVKGVTTHLCLPTINIYILKTSCATNEKPFVVLASGLKYIEVAAGNGPKPNPGDTVKVHYTGWLDGFDGDQKFDSSVDRGFPLDFPVLYLYFPESH